MYTEWAVQHWSIEVVKHFRGSWCVFSSEYLIKVNNLPIEICMDINMSEFALNFWCLEIFYISKHILKAFKDGRVQP